METSRSATTESVKQEDWENPEIQRVGAENPPARAFSPFRDRDQAMQNELADSEWMVSLAGTWSFQWSPDPWSRPVDFYRRDFDASQWSLLKVPSNWQLHGYGVPLYTNKKYPFLKDPPRVTGTPPVEFTSLSLEKSGGLLSAHIPRAGLLVRPVDLSPFRRCGQRLLRVGKRAEGRICERQPHPR